MPEASPSLTVQDLKRYDNADSGRAFTSILVLRRLNAKTASNGNPFFSAEFGDRGGSFNCTIFGDNPAFEALKAAGEGAVARLSGKVDFYQDRFSPRILRMEIISDEEIGKTPELLANLVEVPPEDPGQLWEEFEAFIASIAHDELRMTVRNAVSELGDCFRYAPAAIAMHHAYRHGLLEHTVHMARVCKAILPLYREIDPDLALAGILLHDLGKVEEYEGTVAAKRGRTGTLNGHVVLGYRIARKAGLKASLDADRLERLEHIILSHQGEPAWGAAIYAATPEAVFVSMIDNLDAKMGMVQRALRQATADQDFSERLPGLNTPLLTRPLEGAPKS